MNENKNTTDSTAIAEMDTTRPVATPAEQILQPLELSDDSLFLYSTNYGGKPVQLLKTVLQKAIAAGEAKASAIIAAQRELGETGCNRDERLMDVEKRLFFNAAQQEYGAREDLDVNTWRQVCDALVKMSRWVRDLEPSTRA